MQHGDLVGDGAGRGEVVGDRYRRAAKRADPVADEGVDRAGGDRVEAGGGLVEEQELWVADDRASKAHALLHTARKLGRIEIGDMRGEPHQRHDLDRARARLGAGQPLGVDQAEGDVFPHGKAVEQRAALKQHPHAGEHVLPLRLGEGGDIDPIDPHRAGIGAHQPQRDLDRHRFALPRAADNHQTTPRCHRQIQPIEHGRAIEAFANAFPLQLGNHHFGHRLRSG